MFFLIALISFTMTEILLYHLGWLTLVVPLIYILLMLYYMYYKNSLVARTDIATYEKKIKILELNQCVLLLIIITLSLAISVNFITRMLLV